MNGRWARAVVSLLILDIVVAMFAGCGKNDDVGSANQKIGSVGEVSIPNRQRDDRLPINLDFSPEAVGQYRVRADAGDSKAQYLYSLALSWGIGVVKDESAAFVYASKSASQAFGLAYERLGRAYGYGLGTSSNAVESAKWYKKASGWAQESAKDGDAWAQWCLGICYEYGNGIEKDVVEAVNWYRKAADHGFAEAQCRLGGCYYNGTGVEKNAVEAVKWYRKAADQGYASAQSCLGICYEDGTGVEKNAVEAVKWCRKAADQGYARAQCYLGICYYNGTGVEKNAVEAVKWYRKAADQGYAWAQNNLGICYENGIGVEKDAVEAVKWFRKAADQGDAKAQYNLGRCLLLGVGVGKDVVEAVKWYRKAADQGYADAQHLLGICYENGIGVEKDAVEAVKWYRKAADQGLARAQYNLGRCLLLGVGVGKDVVEAEAWYRKAADQDYKEAKDALGNWKYYCAISVKVDEALKLMSEDPFEAVALLKNAVAQGSNKAKIYLGRCYMNGDGVEKDRAKGLKLRVEAARAGYSQEYMELARESEKLGEAIIWYRLAMDAGIEDGKKMLMWNLGRLLIDRGEYEERRDRSDEKEFGGAGAYKRAWKVDKKFCYSYFSDIVAKKPSQCSEAFLGYCNYMMGLYTEMGWACEADKIMALRWYYRAQAYGNENAVRSSARLAENFSKSTVDAIKKKEGLFNLCKKPEDIEKAASEAGKTMFAIKGFYLGMPISDAKTMVEKYLPKSNVVIMEDGTIEIDVTHKEELDVTPMVFCKADEKGRIVRFNFDERFLKQWFKYDVQNYRDWAAQYGKEFYHLNFDSVEGTRDLGDVSIAVSQEVYRYRDNKRNFVVSYFGKKTVFDPNGEQSLGDVFSNPNKVGRIEGVRAWVNNGWENGDGAREGTLRVELMKDR